MQKIYQRRATPSTIELDVCIEVIEGKVCVSVVLVSNIGYRSLPLRVQDLAFLL